MTDRLSLKSPKFCKKMAYHLKSGKNPIFGQGYFLQISNMIWIYLLVLCKSKQSEADSYIICCAFMAQK